MISVIRRELGAMVAAGTFPQALLFHLQVIAINMPSLRQRH